MVDILVPHFHNTDGYSEIEIGVKEFKCIGAKPPHDHPHIFLDMGKEESVFCPYCSTKFIFNRNINKNETSPPDCSVDS